ncbi:MAG: DNA-3-methyladenine glycosylase 2 family protein [SAR202 cluster bacterium]|nr:DNA-3-methyladenine glycosylase 2 family protein [SAR202 cluster bacterium]
MQSHSLTLTPLPPYNFELTLGHLASFQGALTADVFHDGAYQRLLDIDGKLFLATVRSSGATDNPQLHLTIQAECVTKADIRRVSQIIQWILGADPSLNGFYKMAAKDPILAPLTQKLYGLHMARTLTVFEAFVHAVTAQQIASTVARLIRGLLLETYGRRLSLDGHLYYAFPSPSAIVDGGFDRLRNLKLSARKAEYILDVATAAHTGALDLEGLRYLDDDAISQTLLSLRGVGPWTVHWLMIRALGRPDAFPAGDLALQRVVSHFYFKGRALSAKELDAFSRRWFPYRSFVTTYLFAALRRGFMAF